MQILLETLR